MQSKQKKKMQLMSALSAEKRRKLSESINTDGCANSSYLGHEACRDEGTYRSDDNCGSGGNSTSDLAVKMQAAKENQKLKAMTVKQRQKHGHFFP